MFAKPAPVSVSLTVPETVSAASPRCTGFGEKWIGESSGWWLPVTATDRVMSRDRGSNCVVLPAWSVTQIWLSCHVPLNVEGTGQTASHVPSTSVPATRWSCRDGIGICQRGPPVGLPETRVKTTLGDRSHVAPPFPVKMPLPRSRISSWIFTGAVFSPLTETADLSTRTSSTEGGRSSDTTAAAEPADTTAGVAAKKTATNRRRPLEPTRAGAAAFTFPKRCDRPIGCQRPRSEMRGLAQLIGR
jgi:hypothetical protein